MANVLVIYHARQFALRASQKEHLLAFSEYAEEHDCYYINVFAREIPASFLRIKFDLVIFSWSLLGERFIERDFEKMMERIQRVKSINCPKIALPQDEFSNTSQQCDIINEFSIDIVYSVSPETEWEKMYRTVDMKRVKFFRVLTGYLDEKVVKNLSHANTDLVNRPVDIGFRSGAAAYWGRFNLIKFRIAEEFEKAAKKLGLVTDIAFGWQNFLMGNEWYAFLLKCKYIPGVEGGSSILDWDGSIVESVRSYLAQHPAAEFDEVEKNCIPAGKDGELMVVAMSPRHLEACVTRTCQVLIEGEYNDVLIAGRHYIAIKPDFSNINEVVEMIREDKLRKTITDNAYNDIVLSERYTYRYFANYVIDNSIDVCGNAEPNKRNPRVYQYNKLMDRLTWQFVKAYSKARDVRNLIKK